MNTLDDVLANRVVSAAVCRPDGTVLLVLDGGEALWLYAARRSDQTEAAADALVCWRYATGPHLRELLGLGAPPRPRPGHATDQEAPEAGSRFVGASVVPRADPLAAPDNAEFRQVRIAGHASPLVPDGVYERVSD